jgi:hypothetical protein
MSRYSVYEVAQQSSPLNIRDTLLLWGDLRQEYVSDVYDVMERDINAAMVAALGA